jgi:putative ABC transport system permease protein
MIAGRDFTDGDGNGSEPVSIVSQSVAQRMFENGNAVDRHVWWLDPYLGKPVPRRIVGVVADVDDEHVMRGPSLTVYQPVRQMGIAGRLFVHAAGDPYALVPAVTHVIHEISADQAVEHAATLEDVRTEVLAPERLNAFVFSGFAGVALLIAVVGVAGVLAFTVSARTREFGVRLAVGASPRHVLARVLSEGAAIAGVGILAGALGGLALEQVAQVFVGNMRIPGVLPVTSAAAGLIGAAILASLTPAARASRVDVVQALRSE